MTGNVLKVVSWEMGPMPWALQRLSDMKRLCCNFVEEKKKENGSGGM